MGYKAKLVAERYGCSGTFGFGTENARKPTSMVHSTNQRACAWLAEGADWVVKDLRELSIERLLRFPRHKERSA